MNMRHYEPGYVTERSDNGTRYTLQEKLGQGVQGIVFKSHGQYDPDEDAKDVAVKLALPFTQGAARQMQREAYLMAQVAGPYVVDVLDHSFNEKHPFLVLEYIPENLLNILIEGRMTQDVAAEVIAQTPNMLKKPHEKGIVHLDYKLDNLGLTGLEPGEAAPLDRPDELYLVALDFGIASVLGGAGKALFQHGGRPDVNTQYPPEFFMEEVPCGYRGEANRTTDTYVMGKVLGDLVAGTNAVDVADAMFKAEHLHGVAPPQSFEDMLRSMTAFDPADRPTPDQLKEIARKVIQDLQTREYFFPEDRRRPICLEPSMSIYMHEEEVPLDSIPSVDLR